MRHRRIFDIIESMSRATVELQMELSLMQFRDLAQKQLSCKNREAEGPADYYSLDAIAVEKFSICVQCRLEMAMSMN